MIALSASVVTRLVGVATSSSSTTSTTLPPSAVSDRTSEYGTRRHSGQTAGNPDDLAPSIWLTRI
jgi:hypothetical protein